MAKLVLEKKEKSNVRYISYTKESDYMLIRLNGKQKVVHKIHGETLIERGLAVEEKLPKGSKIEVSKRSIKHVSDIN